MNGWGATSKVWKDKVRIPMFVRTNLEFQCLKGWGANSNVYKDKTQIHVMNGSGANSNVPKP